MKEAFADYKSILEEDAAKYQQDFNRLYSKLEDSHAYYKGQVIPFLYQPFFFSSQELDSFSAITKKLSSILDR
ncbi:MAG: glutathionylspermidine synthase family protein, partial [Bacillota bacterium]